MQFELHRIIGTPNNRKVEIGLRLKGLKPKIVDHPAGNERDAIMQLSGQPLTPVLVHKECVIVDSGAILRYLDANFPETYPLFSDNAKRRRAIECWEAYSRWQIDPLVFRLFDIIEELQQQDSRSFVDLVNALSAEHVEIVNEVNELFAARLEILETKLDNHSWLEEDRVTAADLAVAPMVSMWTIPKDAPGVAQSQVAQFFSQHCVLPDKFARVRHWVRDTFRAGRH